MADDHARDELAQLRAEFATFRAQMERPRKRHLSHRIVPLTLVAVLVALVPLGVLAANPFTDLNVGSVHNANIDAIYNAGITTGCVPNALYCPNDFVTREQMASFLARTAGVGSNPPVANAKTAQTAQTATSADNATNATNAQNAVNATNATNAGNANTVGGYAPSGLVRVARGSGFTDGSALPLATSYQTLASVTITIPGPGFILVNGTVTTYSSSLAYTNTRLRNTAVGGTTSPISWTTIGSAAGSASNIPVSPTWVFPATAAGAQTFVIECSNYSGSSSFANYAMLTALYIPFGSTGANTLNVEEPGTSPNGGNAP